MLGSAVVRVQYFNSEKSAVSLFPTVERVTPGNVHAGSYGEMISDEA
jgi:hypothetical protein